VTAEDRLSLKRHVDREARRQLANTRAESARLLRLIAATHTDGSTVTLVEQIQLVEAMVNVRGPMH
jgi:hypothetical protein